MTTFKEFPYARPDLPAFEKRFRELVAGFSAAADWEAQDEAMTRINAMRIELESLIGIAMMRHTIDTTDAFYAAENEFMDEAGPVLEGLVSEFYAALTASRFRPQLEKKWGAQLFRLAELQMKTFKPEVLADLQAENKLATEYVDLRASARIMFDGAERNLSQMQPFTQSTDRETRRRAVKAVSAFYEANAAGFDRIYDSLVKLRHGIARKLGFENFVGLGYARLRRSDYDAAKVAGYRRQVLETVVPVANRLWKRQAARLGLDSLQFCDEGLEYLTGNATPKGDGAWILDKGRKMYAAMSPETAEFFEYMNARELMDLETRAGKAGGGYCNFIASESAPFIFSNFNGTSGDVDVLTHEAGHAFQAWRSRRFGTPEYFFPTYEAAEIHSMSMEFLAWPWMKDFFGPDEAKYKFSHLSAGILFIPYGVTVDEFQHWVYEHPEACPADRKAAWLAIEKKYLPLRDYGDDDFLAGGGFWYRQGHIFEDPFYYIDYTLAQVCAYEFWGRSMADRESAWKDYLHLCGLGGSLPFTALVAEAHLHDPFVDGTIRSTFEPIERWLEGVDDRSL